MVDDGRILLVDGDNILIRAVIATEGSGMSSGEIETGPLLIFINSLSRYIRELKPLRVVVCWDHSPCEWRLKLHPGYKANRAEGTEESQSRRGNARKLAREFLSLAGIHHTRRPGWEADDLIGGYWRRHRDARNKWILSNDKDLLQLLDTETRVVRVSSANTQTDIWNVGSVVQKYGCAPHHLAKAMALIGDTSDGIPGVHGIGPKKAAKLLQEADWDLTRIQDPRVAEQAAEVAVWYRLINLREEPEGESLPLPSIPHFAPVRPGASGYSELAQFLDSFGMLSVQRRLHDGRLWV